MKHPQNKQLNDSQEDSSQSLINRDLQHIWHPCSQMKDYENFPPLIIEKAKGSYLHLANGDKIIDAISSWWCKSLGHNHPALKEALIKQVDKFEHVILANTTNSVIVELSEKLAALTSHLNKVFYASDGSCAIEIAMKISLQSRQIQEQTTRNKFLAIENSYHGETGLALSVSDVGIYKKPFESMLPETYSLTGIPYVTGKDDPLWSDCSSHWPAIEKQLEKVEDSLTAVIIEPILQGAGGMKVYSADFLSRLATWAQQRGIHVIADEVMTSFGRTGLVFAYQHAKIEPDFVCVSKGLTSGWLPLSAVLTSDDIYQLFYDDYDKGKSFLHSHTFSGNPLAASVALACLKVLERENIYQQAESNGDLMLKLMQQLKTETGKIQNIRAIGSMVAADLISPSNSRLGYAVYQKAITLGALLRPLGNTIYWVPPLNTNEETIHELYNITKQAIEETATS